MTYKLKKDKRFKHEVRYGRDIWHFKTIKERDKFLETPHILWHYDNVGDF